MQGYRKYAAHRVESASKEQLLLMLYREAITRLHKARHMMEEGERKATWLPHVHHARKIAMELDFALDEETAPELVNSLRRLYRWVIQELIEVGSDGKVERIDGVENVLMTLLEGWEKAVSEALATST